MIILLIIQVLVNRNVVITDKARDFKINWQHFWFGKLSKINLVANLVMATK